MHSGFPSGQCTNDRYLHRVEQFIDHFLIYPIARYSQGFALRVAPKPSGVNSTPQGKAVVMERTKKMMESSLMILAVPFEGVTKENTDLLKNALPEGVKASMVKNALIRKCVEGTDFVPLAENLKHENMFLFCPEGTSQASYAALRKWQKDVKRTDAEFCAKVVVIEGEKYNGTELEYVVNLPTKKELLARLCRALKDPPTRLARALKAIPERMAKVFGQVLLQKEEEAKLASLVERIPAAEAAGPPPDDSATQVPSSEAATEDTSETVGAATTAIETAPQANAPVAVDNIAPPELSVPSAAVETASAGAIASTNEASAPAMNEIVPETPLETNPVILTIEPDAETTSVSDTTIPKVPITDLPSDNIPIAASAITNSADPAVIVEISTLLPTMSASVVSASLDSIDTVTKAASEDVLFEAASATPAGAMEDTTTAPPP